MPFVCQPTCKVVSPARERLPICTYYALNLSVAGGLLPICTYCAFDSGGPRMSSSLRLVCFLRSVALAMAA